MSIFDLIWPCPATFGKTKSEKNSWNQLYNGKIISVIYIQVYVLTIPLFTKYSYTLLAITLLFMAASLLCMYWFTEKSIREAATVLVIGSPPIFRAKLAICCLKKNQCVLMLVQSNLSIVITWGSLTKWPLYTGDLYMKGLIIQWNILH